MTTTRLADAAANNRPSQQDRSDFQTIGEIHAAARDALPQAVWDYLSGGAGTESTLRRNQAALDAIGLRARVLRDVSTVDTQTSLLGLPIASPFFLCPIGSLGLIHVGGAAASARAATAAGVTAFFGVNSEIPMHQVVEHASRPLVFQLYVRGDVVWALAQIQQAARLGFHAVCITVDVPVIARRERDLRNAFVPLAAMDRPNLGAQPQNLGDMAQFNWDSLARIIASSPLPVVVKGIQSAEDALLAQQAGAAAVYVSNHGGRQLDHAPAAIETLPEVVDAVGGKLEIYIDGGFTSGADIVKALALGATAVGVGKLQGWALAAGGAAGVQAMLQLLHDELRSTMALLGANSLAQLTPGSVRSLPPLGPPQPSRQALLA